MKIVLVVTQLEGGGAQRVALRLASLLRKRGHHAETWFFYLKNPDAYINTDNSTVMLNYKPQSLKDYWSIITQFYRTLKLARPEVVITFTHYANVLGQFICLLAGVRQRIASQHSPSWSFPKGARYADYLLGSIGVYNSITVVSESVKRSFNIYPRAYRRRLHVIPNGVEFCLSDLSKSAARAKFGFPTDVPVIGNIGRLAKEKNQEVLIRAIANLGNAHLAIVGDGELKEQLQSLGKELKVEGRMHLLGTIAATDIPDFLRALDVFSMPSFFEGMSMALLEALCEGLPIVSSDIPPQVEVLVGEDKAPAGILLPANDVGAWASTFADLLSNHKLQAELRQRAKDRAKDFSTERMVDAYEALILQLLERHGKR